MKKLLFFLALTLSTLAVMSQSTRQFVLVEDFTSTLCTYCPGGQKGCDDLLANGKSVAVVASHSNMLGTDPYSNTYSLARNTMYLVKALPSVCFDASEGYVGGDHTNSMYPAYLPLYNETDTVPSPVDMSMNVTNDGLNYTAVITITLTGTLSSSSNVLYFFVTESDITYSWEGQTKLQHLNRLMVPDQNGTAVSFAGGNTQTITLNFAMNSSWVLNNCEFIATLQDKDAGQGIIPGTYGYAMNQYKVLQTIKQGAVPLTAGFTANVTQIPLNGSVTFTNTTVGGYVGAPESYQWIFDGGTPDTSSAMNPTIEYSVPGTHSVTLIANNGGQMDTLIQTAYIYVGNVGINELNNNSLVIFPNPAKDFMTIQATTNIKKIQVYDVTGQSVIDQTVNANNITVNTSGFGTGVYYLKADLSSGGTIVKKVVIQ